MTDNLEEGYKKHLDQMGKHLDYFFYCEQAYFGRVKMGVLQFCWDFLFTNKHKNGFWFCFW